MGCIQSKVPVEQVSESSLSFSYVKSVQEPSRAVLERNQVKIGHTKQSFGKPRRTISSDKGYSLNEERYFEAKLKVDAWFARREEAAEEGRSVKL